MVHLSRYRDRISQILIHITATWHVKAMKILFGTVPWIRSNAVKWYNLRCSCIAYASVEIATNIFGKMVTAIHVSLSLLHFAEPAMPQRVPIRMFKTHDSYNEFVPILYKNDSPAADMSFPIQNTYGTPSTVCYSWQLDVSAADICSLYGATIGSHLRFEAREWDNWGADYYTGNYSHDEIGSVDVSVYNYGGEDFLNVSPSTDQSCNEQNNILSIECGESDFCIPSHVPCAMDLDCCQTSQAHMFCHPLWGTCINTVEWL